MSIAFVVIAVVFDVSENIDDLMKSGAPFHEVLIDYYLNFCFYFGNLLSSFIVFLAIIWVTSKMAQQTEIVALHSSGVSLGRIMVPYFIAAAILVTVSVVLSHFVVPYANRTKYEFELKYLKGDFSGDEKNIHREIEPGTIVHFKTVNTKRQSGTQFSLEKWNAGKLTFKINGSSARLDTLTNRWTINDAEIRKLHKDGSETVSFQPRLDTTLNMAISEFAQRTEVVTTMSDRQLNDYIRQEKAGGSDKVTSIEIEKYTRTSKAFGIFVLTLIGVSLSSRKTRGGTGLHIMLAVVIGFTFIFIDRITTVAASNAGLPASVAVWLPNLLFFLLGIFLFRKMQQ